MTMLATLYEPIHGALDRARCIFDRELASDVPIIRELCAHVARLRGKMLRPALVLVSGEACGVVTPEHDVLGAVVEMVHMATLVHDDVLDEAELRRRHPTINRLQGNEAAVLLGDYLISHAFHLCSSLDSQYASRLIGATTNTVCEGEIMQVSRRGDLDLTEETYLDIITRKTASLTGTCCVLGAAYAGADAADVARLERYGLDVGIAFQIVDDVLDIVGTEEKVGKTLGRDVDEAKLTLPIIHFLANAPALARHDALAILNNGWKHRAERLRELLTGSESVSYATALARRHVESAVEQLSEMPASPARDRLEHIARFIVGREY